MYFSKLQSIFVQIEYNCKLTSHRLRVQIKQTSIGVVHANCFRFLAWPIVPPSFLDVFYRKYASAAIWPLKPKYATFNLSFGLGRKRSIGCLCISKKNKRNTSCEMRRILISLEFIRSLIFITVLGIVAVWLSDRIFLRALPPTNIAWFYFSFFVFSFTFDEISLLLSSCDLPGLQNSYWILFMCFIILLLLENISLQGLHLKPQ